MDTANVGRGTLIAGVSGVLLFIFMFFSWFGVDVESAIPAGIPEDIANQAIEESGFDTTVNGVAGIQHLRGRPGPLLGDARRRWIRRYRPRAAPP